MFEELRNVFHGPRCLNLNFITLNIVHVEFALSNALYNTVQIITNITNYYQ